MNKIVIFFKIFYFALFALQGKVEAQCTLSTKFSKDTLFVKNSDVINYKVNITGGTKPFTYLWSPPSGVTCYTCEVPNSTLNSKFQTINVVVTDSMGCTTTASQYVRCSNCAPCSLVATLDTNSLNILEGDTPPQIEIKYTGNEGKVNIEWLPVVSVSCFYCLKTRLISDQTVEYVATVTDERGCKSKVKFLLNVEKYPTCDTKIFVPTTFSPNDDGINDFFTLFSNHCVKEITKMQIFDRWGNILFHKENFAPNDEISGWNSSDTNNDTYIYIIEYLNINKKLFTTRGSINAIKN